MGEIARDRTWRVEAACFFFDAARGAVDAEDGLRAVLAALARAGIAAHCYPEAPPSPVPSGSQRRTLHGGAGQVVGVVELPDSVPPAEAEEIAATCALFLDLPARVSLPRPLAHELANKLAGMLANAELVEWLIRQPAEDRVTMREAAAGCLSVTRELIAAVDVLQAQRSRGR